MSLVGNTKDKMKEIEKSEIYQILCKNCEKVTQDKLEEKQKLGLKNTLRLIKIKKQKQNTNSTTHIRRKP